MASSQTTTEPSLARFLAEHYGTTKARFPGEGRRKWRLRVAELFWGLSSEQKGASISQNPVLPESVEDADFTADDDPLDAISDDAPGVGLLLRTDYSDEGAWQAFYAKLQEAEAELASEPAPSGADAAPGTPREGPSGAQAAASSSTDAEGDTAMDVEDEDAEADAEADDGDDGAPIFYVINASPAERARFTGISNLAALRLLNDVDVRRAPAPPQGTKRIRPPNRLVDHDGWQEVYVGKTVWVYDTRSNADQCVRLVSPKSAAMYGTATADSWRARVSHICELQVNMASGALTIDFGGLDRWDYGERVRNLEEAVRPVS
ncbi:hypothetical protein BD413DRAFT_652167 [Trametes elegans]|nr:hypothetical protein BD413DRAFT_652167 [Trametes elegans]